MHVHGIEAQDKVDERVLVRGGHGGEEGLLDGVARGEGAGGGEGGYGEVEAQGLGINVADVDATLVGEEDGVALAARVDADVVFGLGGVREEGLNDEGRERASDVFDLFK
jgi:hypothetical protein